MTFAKFATRKDVGVVMVLQKLSEIGYSFHQPSESVVSNSFPSTTNGHDDGHCRRDGPHVSARSVRVRVFWD
jgi:hypothetical protein